MTLFLKGIRDDDFSAREEKTEVTIRLGLESKQFIALISEFRYVEDFSMLSHPSEKQEGVVLTIFSKQLEVFECLTTPSLIEIPFDGKGLSFVCYALLSH